MESITEESTTADIFTENTATVESITEEETTVEPTTADTTTVESTTNEIDNVQETTVEPTTEQPTTPAICPIGVFGNVPHPDNCQSYYLCTGGMAIQLYCATGYEFDPVSNVSKLKIFDYDWNRVSEYSS